MTTTETIDHLEAQLALLEPAERLEVLSRFCKYCGAYDPDCRCWNDE